MVREDSLAEYLLLFECSHKIIHLHLQRSTHSQNIRAAITQDGESGRPDRSRHPSPALSSTSDAASHHQPSAPIMDQIDDAPLHSHDDRTPPTDPSPVYIPPHRRDSAVPQSEMGKLATYLAGDAAASSYPQPSSTPKPAGSNPYSGDCGRRTRSRASQWDRGPTHGARANYRNIGAEGDQHGGGSLEGHRRTPR